MDAYTVFAPNSLPISKKPMHSNTIFMDKVITDTGSGSLTVNGHTMTFSANTGELYIDIRRKIAYNANGVNQNSVISGDYDDMRLQHGTNSISVSGGSLRVYPKWGFKI